MGQVFQEAGGRHYRVKLFSGDSLIWFDFRDTSQLDLEAGLLPFRDSGRGHPQGCSYHAHVEGQSSPHLCNWTQLKDISAITVDWHRLGIDGGPLLLGYR